MNKVVAIKKLFVKLHFGVSLFLFLAVAVNVVRAERLPVRIYTSADGLGSSAAFNIVRDSRGFIWLCSRDGLIRFDGYRFITYRIGKDDADPAVFDLIPTKSGIYWINLNRGTDYRFVAKDDTALLEPIQQQLAKNDPRITLSVEPLTDVRMPRFEDKAGNLWTADEKGIYLMKEVGGHINEQLIKLNLPGNPESSLTRAVFCDGSDGSLWIGTNWGLVRRLPDGKQIHYSLRPENNRDTVLFITEAKDGRIWIARPEGLFVMKVEPISGFTNSGEFTTRKIVIRDSNIAADGQAHLPEQTDEAFAFSFTGILRRDSVKEGSPKPTTFGLLSASDGKIWITNNRGLIVFDGKRFQHFVAQQGFGQTLISSIVEDNEGHLWLSSYSGLLRLNPKGLTSFDYSDGLAETRVHSIYEDREGSLNVVTDNYNISRFENGVFKSGRPPLPNDATWVWHSNVAFLDSRGDWWIITRQKLYRYSGINHVEEIANKQPTAVYTTDDGLVSNDNFHVFEDSKGDIWISATNAPGQESGLNRWQRSTGKFEKFTTENGLPKGAASSLAEDKAGNLWFGFIEGGLVRYKDGRFTLLDEKDGAPTRPITNLYTDKKGRLWIASSQIGLLRVDDPTAEHPAFKQYTIADGLTSNNIRCITEDLSGNIYLGTVRGVNRLSPDTGHIKYYGTGDGLASDFVSVAYRDRHGAIWFGTYSGLSKLVPEPDTPLQAPPILISSLRIAGVDYSVSPLGQKEVFAPEQSASRNNLQIDFLSISNGGNSSIRYQYKLEGTDSDWSALTAERSVTFANLSPGAYRFLVRAVNADNTSSQQPASVSFTILRPIWQRWWFMSAVAILIGLAGYAFYRYRVSHLLKLERVRTRIATDLHDDIGSSLSQIAILSEVVRQKVGNNANGTTEPLNLIADKSREMVDSMSDIVWAINPHKDHLGDLVHRMHRFAGDMLESKDIDYHFTLPDEEQDVSLGADIRREVYLMFKECVNNLVKHSDATKAEIEIKLERDCLILKIADNGRGFDIEHQSNGNSNGFGGNGLKNMMQRTKNLGGEFSIDSQKGNGTRITIKIPVSKKLFTA